MNMLNQATGFVARAATDFRVQATIAVPALATTFALSCNDASVDHAAILDEVFALPSGFMSLTYWTGLCMMVAPVFAHLLVFYFAAMLNTWILQRLFRARKSTTGSRRVRHALLAAFYYVYFFHYQSGFELTGLATADTWFESFATDQLSFAPLTQLPYFHLTIALVALFSKTAFVAVVGFLLGAVFDVLSALVGKLMNLISWENTFAPLIGYSLYFDCEDFVKGALAIFREYTILRAFAFVFPLVFGGWATSELDFWLVRGAMHICTRMPEMNFSAPKARKAKTAKKIVESTAPVDCAVCSPKKLPVCECAEE